jgi:hypothetical protein
MDGGGCRFPLAICPVLGRDPEEEEAADAKRRHADPQPMQQRLPEKHEEDWMPTARPSPEARRCRRSDMVIPSV